MKKLAKQHCSNTLVLPPPNNTQDGVNSAALFSGLVGGGAQPASELSPHPLPLRGAGHGWSVKHPHIYSPLAVVGKSQLL